ncbi:MAG: hypothetical protein A2021_07925 [Elusimicrobia bacterium GWF2_52_66]|nr:MAG: hypothetical protein A2X33_04540 [Elusimicrobia bacterium GWA2_51_34]OGR87338.1 MAG: hypothetical protein A2021_07925 [Elusimicrobia bacterium GWF2_52_66]HAF94924.1 hypothetical protein [Elusimicrobiota bacterium]HCE97502.1 hypothetical protein [Elusimicrobiota bacterium]
MTKSNRCTNKRLILCSRGLKPGHLTVETMEVLKACDVLFSGCIDAQSSGFFSSLCPRVRIKMVKGGPEEISEKVIEEISRDESCRTAVFMSYGNTRFLCGPVFQLEKKAKKAGIELFVMDGVSSVDSIVNMMNLNKFATDGLRLVDIDACLKCRKEIVITPGMDTCFFMFWRLLLEENKVRLEKFLRDVRKNYLPHALGYFLNCPSLCAEKGRIIKFRIADLPDNVHRSDKESTLFIPAQKNVLRKSA